MLDHEETINMADVTGNLAAAVLMVNSQESSFFWGGGINGIIIPIYIFFFENFLFAFVTGIYAKYSPRTSDWWEIQWMGQCRKTVEWNGKADKNPKVIKRFNTEYQWINNNNNNNNNDNCNNDDNSEPHQILSDFEIQTDRLISARRPDLVRVNKKTPQ